MIYQVACLILFSVSDALAGYHERIELFSSLAPRKEDELGQKDGNTYLIGIMNGEINPLFILYSDASPKAAYPDDRSLFFSL